MSSVRSETGSSLCTEVEACDTLHATKLDQFDHCPIRISKADKQIASSCAVRNDLRLREKFHSRNIGRFHFVAQRSQRVSHQSDPGHACMVEMWIGSAFGLGTFPFNQIKTRRASIIANLKERSAT